MTIEAELPRLAGGSTRDHVLLANTALVDRVDLATKLSLSSRPTTGLSALAPAQRAGAQRLCALAPFRPADRLRECLFIGWTGSDQRRVRTTRLNPKPPKGDPSWHS